MLKGCKTEIKPTLFSTCDFLHSPALQFRSRHLEYAQRNIENDKRSSYFAIGDRLPYLWFFPYYSLGVEDEFPALDITVCEQNNSDGIAVELGLSPTVKVKCKLDYFYK